MRYFYIKITRAVLCILLLCTQQWLNVEKSHVFVKVTAHFAFHDNLQERVRE